ncbi:MAG: NAD(P)/FAD-dependent oxidoreductase [Chloroflexota bacterium]
MTGVPDVLIVGAGAAGAAVGYEAVKRGLSVTIIEKDSIGSHASGFSFGGLFPTMGAGIPGPMTAHAKRGVTLHKRLAPVLDEETGMDVGLRAARSLELAMTAGELDRMRERLKWQRSEDLEGELLDGQAAKALEPAIGPEPAGALLQRCHFGVDSYRYTLALVTAVERHGGIIRHDQVVGLDLAGRRVNGVTLASGETVKAGAIVLATGPWSGGSSQGSSESLPSLPVRPVKGEILRLNYPGRAFIHRVSAGGCYIARKPDGLVWAGSTEQDAGFDERPSADARDSIMRRVVSLAPPVADARVELHTACLRPVSDDDMPVLGPAPGYEGLFAATGAGKKGILLSPVIGRMVAGAVAGDPAKDPIPPEFDVSRYAV